MKIIRFFFFFLKSINAMKLRCSAETQTNVQRTQRGWGRTVRLGPWAKPPRGKRLAVEPTHILVRGTAGAKQATRVQVRSKPPVCRCEASHIITIMLNTYKVVLTVSVII